MDATGSEETEKSRALLVKVAQQHEQLSPVAEPLSEGTRLNSRTIVAWSQREQQGTRRRSHFAGLVFGTRVAVVEPLFQALDQGVKTGRFDEEFIATLFRALIELEFLKPLAREVACEVIDRICDETVHLKSKECVSAFLGVLGVLTRAIVGLVEEASRVERCIKLLVDTPAWWFDEYGASGVVCEAVWALCWTFEGADAKVLLSCEERCCKLATRVCESEYYQRGSEYYNESNEAKALRYAEKLRLLFAAIPRHDNDAASVPEVTGELEAIEGR